MEKSINVKYISLNDINKMYTKILPVGDYKIIWVPYSPISRIIITVTSNEPGLMLNHESSFFSF
jgi:hypothetical protein